MAEQTRRREPATTVTVAEVRAFIARTVGIPDLRATHHAIVANTPVGLAVITCCDDVDAVTGMISDALTQLGGDAPVLAPASRRVIVHSDDLRTVLSFGVIPEDVLVRLHEALGEARGDLRPGPESSRRRA